MRILHVDTATEWRGGQRQLELLVGGLAARGHRQAVACPPGSPLWERLEGAVAVRRLALRPGGGPLGLPRLRRLSLDFELVAAHSSHAHQACLAVARPLVVHRRVDFPAARGPLGRWKYGAPAAIICVSEAVARVLAAAGVPRERLAVVYDGVEPPPAAAAAELGPGPVVLAVGALVPHKDHATLERAARGLEARVLVAGEGPLRSELEGGALELLGQRSDVPALLARADVFVHSSREEGMGQAVAEAMFAGVPVVATAAGGVPEVLGEAGILVPVGDSEALRAALRRALAGRHPPVDRARTRAARRFSVGRMVEDTAAVYRSVLSAGGGG